jgi:hypothetical protein
MVRSRPLQKVLSKGKNMTNDYDLLNEIKEKIEKHFSDPKNVEKFKKYMDEELKKPYMTQLSCINGWCKYCEPKNCEMGTITYCTKYKATEPKDICKDREWLEMC